MITDKQVAAARRVLAKHYNETGLNGADAEWIKTIRKAIEAALAGKEG